MNLTQPLTLNEGVFLLPVAELPDEVRERLDPDDGDFALTRPQGRNGSKILDRDAAELVERFRRPHTLAEAVILFSRARGAQPEEVLESAFPLIRGLLATGYLVVPGEGAAPQAGGALPSHWRAGDELLGGQVERVLQVLEDTELYLLRRPGQNPRVVKAIRRGAGNAAMAETGLVQEARILEVLAGDPAPELFVRGEVDGRAYLEIEHVAGVELEAEIARLREDRAPRGERLRRAVAVAEAYARLHGRGVLHGDVHPRNLLVERDGTVRVIDFGLAQEALGGETHGRGGVPFFYEPELALAFRDGTPPPPATPAGEQYAVAVIAYLLLTGSHPRDYSLGRREMLEEIVELPPLPFAERGAESWPEAEAVLGRALAREPAERYPSMEAFAAALAAVPAGAERPAASSGEPGGEAILERCLAAAGGEWLAGGELPAPSASVNYGAAGVSLALLAVAQARDDAGALALADVWLERARRGIGSDGGFYEPEIEITREMVGESSPYHSASGVHAAAALVARAQGNRRAQGAATAAFLAACEAPANGFDLTLGRASHLLGAAILLDALPRDLVQEEAALRLLGDGALAEIWHHLDGEPAILESGIDYPGVAHGWAGFLYATLVWCEVSGAAIPAGLERRSAELAELAVPAGRGLVWPWTLTGEGRHATMPGWCNGSCGYVFLWTRVHRLSGEARHLDLAAGAAWDAWDAPDGALSLCCGLAGRGYALLDLYRQTGEAAWLGRARTLAERAARRGRAQLDREHSLYKGNLGLAVLAADLERPEAARMPLFQPAGYREAS